MKGWRITVLSAALALSFPVSAVAQGIWAEGTIDCGRWTEARSQRRAEVFEGYLQGLLNGMALGSRIEIWHAGGVHVTKEQVFLWMDNYCWRNPLSQIIAGAVALTNERTGGAWARKQ